MFRLDGQRALVTGGTSGIGEGTARVLLQAGARVVVAARGQTRGPEAVEALRAHGEVHFAPADVRDEEAVRRLVAETVERLGGLDLLVNNAGTVDRTPLHDLEADRWEAVLRSNLTSVYLCSRHALPHLRARGGAVVNVASYLAFRAGSGLTVAYNAAKAGIVSLTRTMAVAYGPDGVRVNAVCPGFVPTALNRSMWEKIIGRCSEISGTGPPRGRAGERLGLDWVRAEFLASHLASGLVQIDPRHPDRSQCGPAPALDRVRDPRTRARAPAAVHLRHEIRGAGRGLADDHAHRR